MMFPGWKQNHVVMSSGNIYRQSTVLAVSNCAALSKIN